MFTSLPIRPSWTHNLEKNVILNTDSYKPSHWLQYPDGTTNVYSYIESRFGQFPKTVFVGVQPYVLEYLTKPVTRTMIKQAKRFFKAHGEPFNEAGWLYILREHKGYLPVRVKAAREGSVIPTGNVLVTVEVTDPKCFWLTSYIETGLLRAVWYPTTVATISWSIKQVILKYLHETGDPSLIDFKLHDFGSRGVSSKESSGLGGLAHLVNFMGTDNIEGIIYAMKYYFSPDVCGFSIPASEHSTMTALGPAGELAQMRRMLRTFGKPKAMFACVSDSYDIDNAVDNNWGGALRQEILDSGAVLVVRPDSGKPSEVVLRCVQKLDKAFGHTIVKKPGGEYKVLHPSVRVIQGDGINLVTIQEILFTLKMAGYSADNVAFGMGGALLQIMNRDTQGFAMKASAMEILGEWVKVFKQPKTDPSKNSKPGRVTLYRSNDGHYYSATDDIIDEDMLYIVYEKLLGEEKYRLPTLWSFEEVREQSNAR